MKGKTDKPGYSEGILWKIPSLCFPLLPSFGWWWSAMLWATSPADADAMGTDSSHPSENPPQRASSSWHLLVALALWKDEFTGRQTPKFNKNYCLWWRNPGTAFALQKYIKHIWKVPLFFQEGTLECQCGLGWALINLKNVGQVHCKSVITSFSRNKMRTFKK